jgi:3-hydroxyacyl-[acyl-carrier-protein] dehydratase
MKGIDYIEEALPNRYPLLLIDRVLEEGEGWVRALKNVTIDEPFFPGHFPGEPIMPGSLILEGMAQAAGLILGGGGRRKGRIGYLVGVDRARFRRPVRPGDQLIYEARLTRSRGGLHRAEVTATVAGERVAEATISIALQEQR